MKTRRNLRLRVKVGEWGRKEGCRRCREVRIQICFIRKVGFVRREDDG